MADLDRFERRLAASLERLADEVSTEVEPQQVTADLVAGSARPRWLGWTAGDRGLRLAPLMRVVLVVAATLALLVGLLIVGQRQLRAPIDATTHGRMTCLDAPPASRTGAVAFDCTSDLADSRLAGAVRIRLDEAIPVGGAALRPGTIELDGDGAAWTGSITVTSAPNDMATGEAELAGDGRAAGLVLRLRLLGGNGREWGLLGWIEARP